MKSVKVFAPATIGNIGPGFDVLGLAIQGIGDIVEAKEIAGNDLIIESDTDDDAVVIVLHTEDLAWHHYAITITGSGSTAVA